MNMNKRIGGPFRVGQIINMMAKCETCKHNESAGAVCFKCQPDFKNYAKKQAAVAADKI